MRYYPINVDVAGRPVVVIGGGGVALQKVLGLLEAKATVRVIAPRVCPEIESLGREGRLQVLRKEYEEGDLSGAVLAFGATDRPEVNRRIHQEAGRKGVLFNAVDEPNECDFTVPSRLSRGELLLTISTGGRAPFLSKALRKRLEQLFGPECEDWVLLWSRLRDRLIAEGRKDELLPFFDQEGDRLLNCLRKNEKAEVEKILQERFGPDYSLPRLGIE